MTENKKADEIEQLANTWLDAIVKRYPTKDEHSREIVALTCAFIFEEALRKAPTNEKDKFLEVLIGRLFDGEVKVVHTTETIH